jgi:hypothetical protein
MRCGHARLVLRFHREQPGLGDRRDRPVPRGAGRRLLQPHAGRCRDGGNAAGRRVAVGNATVAAFAGALLPTIAILALAASGPTTTVAGGLLVVLALAIAGIAVTSWMVASTSSELERWRGETVPIDPRGRHGGRRLEALKNWGQTPFFREEKSDVGRPSKRRLRSCSMPIRRATACEGVFSGSMSEISLGRVAPSPPPRAEEVGDLVLSRALHVLDEDAVRAQRGGPESEPLLAVSWGLPGRASSADRRTSRRARRGRTPATVAG